MPENILNQPIQFGLSEKFVDDEHYQQPVFTGDTLNFQILLDVDDTDLVADGLGSYTQDPVSQWQSSSGLYKQLGNDGELYQDVLTANKYYQLNFTVEDLNNAGSLLVYIGTNLIETITAEGDYTLYGQATGNTRITFDAGAETEVRITDSVTAYLVENGLEVIATDREGIYQEDVVSSEDNVVNRNAQYQNIALPDLECFKLNIVELGTDELVGQNEEDWTLGDGLVFQTGSIRSDDISTEIDPEAYQDLTPTETTTYDFTAEISLIKAIVVTFTVTNLSTNEVVFSQVEDSNGIKEFGKIGLEGGTTYRVALNYEASNIDNDALVSISLIAYETLLVSNSFVKTPDTDSTIKITASNNNYAYGIYFHNSFQFELRIEGSIQHPRPETEAEFYKGSQGVRTLYYSDDTERWRLVTGMMPIYIHRALRKLSLMNTFNVDGTRYVALEESYEVEWPQNGKLANAEFSITERTQDYYNRI